MKKILFLAIFGFLTITITHASNYKLNDQSIENLFSKAQVINITQFGNELSLPLNNAPTAQLSEKDPLIAFLLCTFLGSLGIHRAYLGTETLVIVGYICTGGGCGIVTTVDWVMLLISVIKKEDIGKYTNNPKFFMWM